MRHLPGLSCTTAARCSVMSDMDTLQSVGILLNQALAVQPFALQHVASDVLRLLQENGRFERGLIGVLNEQGSELSAFVSPAHASQACDRLQLDPGRAPLAEVLKTGQPLLESQSSHVTGIAK